jgi:hypothetical protein
MLAEAEVLSPKDWEAMVLPEDGNLVDALLANGERLSDKWVRWLVRYHGMFRVAEPKWDQDGLPSGWKGHRTLHQNWCVALMKEEQHLWIGRCLPKMGVPYPATITENTSVHEIALHPKELKALLEEQQRTVL